MQTASRTRIGMLVHSDYVHDHRVRREAQALAGKGCDVHVWAGWPHHAHRTFEIDGVTVHALRLDYLSGKRRFLELMRKLNKKLHKTHLDIIHAHDLDTLWPAARYAQRNDVPLIYDSHELYTESIGLSGRPIPRFLWWLVERKFIHKADGVITVCDGIADELQQRYELSDKPVVVRNIASQLTPAPLSNGSVLDQTLSRLHRHANYLGIYAGYLQKGRGLEQTLDAIGSQANWGLVICGQGPLSTWLDQQIRSRHLENRVQLLGNLNHPELFTLISQCDLGFCLIEPLSKSYYYALPNKLTEYVQCGIPVAGSDLPEIKRIIDHYRIGFVVRDSKDLQKVLNDFEKLKNAKNLAKSLKEAQDTLNWEREQKRLFKLYQRFCPNLRDYQDA